MHPSPSGPPLLFPSPSLQTPSNPPRPLSTGAIIGIAFGALAAVMCTALALFFLVRRRARRRSKRMSIESSLRHLEPHSYDDGPSLSPVSSVWTGFGSVSVDPDFEPQSEPSAHSLDFQFAEKHASFQRSEGCAPSPSLSPCPSTSPALAETQPLARGMSPLPLAPSHDDLHLSHLLGVPSPAPGALSFPNLLALARTDYPGVANPLNHGGPQSSECGGAVRARARGLATDTHSEKALRIPDGMPAYKFDPITATGATLPGDHPFIFAFAAPAETAVSGATTFPLGVAVSGAVVLAAADLSDNDCDEDSDSSKTPPGHGGTPPGQEKKACSTGSTTAAPTSSSTTTPSPSQSPSPPSQSPSPPTAPTLTSPEVDPSQSTRESSSTSDTDDSATSTGASQPPSSTRSLDPQGTTTGSTTTSSTSYSLSTPLAASSHSGVPAANLSIPPTPTAPTPTQPSSATATPASGLSAGSAIGIALGVFAAAGMLVAAALFLFLFLRKRKRKRRRKRESVDSTPTLKRQLTSESSEGSDAPSRPLSSTWSWFGSLPIGSEHSHGDPDPDPEHECRYGYYGASPHPRPRPDDDPFQDQGTEKGAIVGNLRPRTPTRAASPNPFAPPAHFEPAPPPASQPESEDSEDAA
ncbi:hypothetical protein LXA43DRAFT_1067752 [Ganoderma leucocontextum]|nr:hypothetical protein LXA43DRAFT_1067752 [Ganoderma leucocontextum]